MSTIDLKYKTGNILKFKNRLFFLWLPWQPEMHPWQPFVINYVELPYPIIIHIGLPWIFSRIVIEKSLSKLQPSTVTK